MDLRKKCSSGKLTKFHLKNMIFINEIVKRRARKQQISSVALRCSLLKPYNFRLRRDAISVAKTTSSPLQRCDLNCLNSKMLACGTAVSTAKTEESPPAALRFQLLQPYDSACGAAILADETLQFPPAALRFQLLKPQNPRLRRCHFSC